MRSKSMLLFVAALLCTGAAFGANIVSNPGFETGDFTGWTTHQCATCPASGWFAGPGDPHTGTDAAGTACVGTLCLDPAAGDWISQSLTTTATTVYTFSFWMDPVASNNNATVEIDVFWNGTLRGSFASEPSGYHQFTISGLVATGSTSTLELTGRHDPATVWIDDVCVSSSSDCGSVAATPEPATLFTLSGGFTALGLMALGRRFVLNRASR